MRKSRQRTCDNCGKPLELGNTIWFLEGSDGEVFCCEECLRKHVSDTLVEDAINEYMEAHAVEGMEEEADPWDRYGVGVKDFF